VNHLITHLPIDVSPTGSGWDISNRIVEAWSAGRVKRYHIEPTHTTQNVADHSFGVAAIVTILWPYSSAELLRAAIFHDIAEKRTGDMPGPVKKANPELKKLMDAAEFDVILGMGFVKHHESQLSEEDRKKLKTADHLEALLYCIFEEAGGNRLISHTVTHCYNEVQNDGLPEVMTVADILMMRHRRFMGGE
jgi:5'-deoxynucleotidase YfbR-like HD superfamily hydrolase